MPADQDLHWVSTGAFKSAASRGEELFGTDDLLWPILANPDSMGSWRLRKQGVDLEVVKSQLRLLSAQSRTDPSVRESEHIAAATALVSAEEVAKLAQSHFTGTDHLVLGFVRGLQIRGSQFVSVAHGSLISAGVDGRKLYSALVPSLEERRQIEASALGVLRERLPQIQQRHRVRVADAALQPAVSLSSRYVSRGDLQDKAVAVVDTAASVLRLIADNEARAKFPHDVEAQRVWAANQSPDVTEQHIAKVIELWTGIPAAKLTEQGVH